MDALRIESSALQRFNARFAFANFGKGFLVGLGSVVGASIGVALLLWFLGLFDQIPFIGDIVDAIERTIEDGPSTSN